jgi:integrase
LPPGRKTSRRKNTLHLVRTMLEPAIADFGHVKVRELKPIVVSDWLAKMADRGKKRAGRERPWSGSTQKTALAALIRVFNWAKGQGIVTKNPVAGMAKPEKRVRGKEVVLPEPLQHLLIEVANPALAKFLRMLRGTGARPGEIIHAECRHYKGDIGDIVFHWNPAPGEYRWKAGKKPRRDRVIYLSPDLQELVEGEIEARGGKRRFSWPKAGVPG